MDAFALKEPEPSSPTVVLWTHPRSVSTAFEACFSQRNDCLVHHEPGARLRHYKYLKRRNPDGRTKPQVRADVIKAYTERIPGKFTFIKDMAYYLRNRISMSLLRHCRHTFLVRRPEDALLSHYKKNASMTEEEAGYDALQWVFEQVSEFSPDCPVVFEGNDFRERPEKVLSAYCSAIGVPYLPEALTWKAGDRPEWELWKTTGDWHAEVAASTGVQPQEKRAEPDDLPGNIREMLPRCRAVYEAILAKGSRL